MFAKTHLLLLCAVLWNIGEGSSENATESGSDCGDLIKCASTWMSGFIANNEKEATATKNQSSHLFNNIEDLLARLSSFIQDTFENITKDKTLVKNASNKTAIGVQTFTVNDTDQHFRETKNKVSMNVIEMSKKQLNDTNNFVIMLNNETGKIDDIYNSINVKEEFTTPDKTEHLLKSNFKSGTNTNIIDELKTKIPEKHIIESEKPVRKGSNLSEMNSDTLIVVNMTLSPIEEFGNETNAIPMNSTDFNVSIHTNIKVKNDSAPVILEKVTSNYKIAYETPINATHSEIKANSETHTSHNGLMDKTTNNDNNTLKAVKNKIQSTEIPNEPTNIIETEKNYDYYSKIYNFTHFELESGENNTFEQSFTVKQNKNNEENFKENHNSNFIRIETNNTEPIARNRTANNELDVKRKNIFNENDISKNIHLTELPIQQKKNGDNNIENNSDKMTHINNKLSKFMNKENDDVYDDETKNPYENENMVHDDVNNIDDENATDYLELDYITLYKDVTVEDVGFTPPTYLPSTAAAASDEQIDDNGIVSIFPWIATIFVKNPKTDQFEYICDGSLVSESAVLTAAQCLVKSNVTEDTNNVLVLLGKRSLKVMGPNEKVFKVYIIRVHENFTATEGNVDNDLAIILLDETVTFNDDVEPVLLANGDGDIANESATTGWRITNGITPIYFNKDSGACVKNTRSVNTFCARFGNDITTCPSFGGVFVSRHDTTWRLHGINTGKPTSMGVCFDKTVTFTNISYYYQWISDNMNVIKGQ